MNKQTAGLLEQHFDTAFAAPDGIKKLRELILTLATQGKLVEQDPSDPPAIEQHRIVARIDQLMSLCDTLEQQINAATRKQTKLLEAVMAQV